MHRKVEIFEKYFFNRTDRVGILANWGSRSIPGPAAPDDGDFVKMLLSHIGELPKGETAYAITNTTSGTKKHGAPFHVGTYAPDENAKTRWLCLDFDGNGPNHDNGLVDPLGCALLAAGKCSSVGAKYHLESSASATGYHLWLLFSEPKPAETVRRIGRWLAPVGLLSDGNESDATAGRGIEIFPKQDRHRSSEGGVGHMVWLPWWEGAKPGGNVFVYDNGDPIEDQLAAFNTDPCVDEDAWWALCAASQTEETREEKSTVAEKKDVSTETTISDAEWREMALSRLDLDSVYGSFLTGRSSGNGWLQCRDPWSPTGDRTPSAGVADGTGQAERGRFCSFISGESLSVFDYLMKRDGVTLKDAMDEVAKMTGVQRPRIQRKENTASRRVDIEESQEKDSVGYLHDNTDAANAVRLAKVYGDKIRYSSLLCHDGWLVWDGKKWIEDVGAERVSDMALVVAKKYAFEKKAEYEAANSALKSCVDDDSKGALKEKIEILKTMRKWAVQSQKSGGIHGCLELAKFSVGISSAPDDFDADPWLLNCRNGVVNLRTGELSPHDSKQLHTRIAYADWIPSAKSEEWERFLVQVLPDESTRRWIQRWAGTCLTGITTDRAIVMLVGIGANGKSVFLESLSYALGSYAGTTSPELFATKKGADSEKQHLLAEIKGLRLLTASETEKNAQLNGELLKQLTGGEQMIGRKMYCDPMTFRPQCKPVFGTNNRPRSSESGKAIFDRLAIVEFLTRFEKHEQDRDLTRRLKLQSSAILQWAYDGLKQWMADGDRLLECEAVKAAVDEYSVQENALSEFFSSCVEQGEGLSVTVKKLFSRYQEWCNHECIPEMHRKGKGTLLKEMKDTIAKCWRATGTNGVAIYKGVGLKDWKPDVEVEKVDAIRQIYGKDEW